MNFGKETSFRDKHGNGIKVGDFIYYTEAPERYADSLALIVEIDGKFCQATIVYNKSCPNDNGEYLYQDLETAIKKSVSMEFNSWDALEIKKDERPRLLDTEILSLKSSHLDLNDSDFFVKYMNERFPFS